MSARLDAVLAEVVAWGRETFPASTDATKTRHIIKEAIELDKHPGDPSEMADVLMILAHLAASKGVDLADAVANKLAVCRIRTWAAPNAEGIIEHVRERKPWDEYFFDVARMVASRATCPRASIGAVLILRHRIIGTGYNGVPSGEPHCEDTPEHAALDHCRAAIHAEINALRNCSADPEGATLYVVGPRPICLDCTKKLRAAGVTEFQWSAT